MQPTTVHEELPLRLGIAFAGDPDDPTTWSGTPSSLGNAFRELGVTVKPLGAEPRRLLGGVTAHLLTLTRLYRTSGTTLFDRARVSRATALYTGRRMSILRTRALFKHVRSGLPLNAVVQIGTAYGIPPGLRVATFEDLTVRQALALGYPYWTSLSQSERDSAIKRQTAAYSQASVCCFATQWAANSAIEDYGVAREKVHAVGLGRNHSPLPAPRDWRTPRFLFVGSDWRVKNGDAVLRSFARVRERVPSARLDLVGDHPRVELSGVEGHGWLSLHEDGDCAKLNGLYQVATCLVLPSWFEAGGISYLEAAAAGVPSIGTTAGGSAELIGDGGRVVDPGNEEALFKTMLLFSNGEAARRTGSRALARADQFTWHKVARRILAALSLDGAQCPPAWPNS